MTSPISRSPLDLEMVASDQAASMRQQRSNVEEVTMCCPRRQVVMATKYSDGGGRTIGKVKRRDEALMWQRREGWIGQEQEGHLGPIKSN